MNSLPWRRRSQSMWCSTQKRLDVQLRLLGSAHQAHGLGFAEQPLQREEFG
ncbi:MAG: hypothetical protein Q8R06_02640 [Polaromonas sp.]|uniref:hypothetical protein n=1 Tax=Polaromonas sp. TaxID=1869339 RepID=UPI002734264A|nr:hypothetical protein [Polaromonas sp.]MDP3796033.1 hypothetical protein [Polaromonas sp.]